MDILGLVLKFGKMLMAYILDFSVGFPNTVCQCLPRVLWRFFYGILYFWGFCDLVVVWSFFHYEFFVRCEEYAECEWALKLNSRHVFFECGYRRY